MSRLFFSFVGVAVLAWTIQVIRTAPGQPEFGIDHTKIDKSSYLEFDSTSPGTKLRGRLHLPNITVTDKPPVVVMAHGFGLVQDIGLQPYIQAINSAGMAVFTFDYATFGASDGLPRHQVDPWRQIDEIHQAVKYLKSGNHDIDATRMALWGTSLGGGHVLSYSATKIEKNIRAVIANVPHVQSGLESMISVTLKQPDVYLPAWGKFLAAVLRWLCRMGRPWYLPLHGPPGSAAIMQTPGDDEGYASLYSKQDPTLLGWTNAATVGSAIRVLLYRPLSVLHKVDVPTLLIGADLDTLCPLSAVQKAHDKMGESAEFLLGLATVDHFGVYKGKALQRGLKTIVPFLKKYLFNESYA